MDIRKLVDYLNRRVPDPIVLEKLILRLYIDFNNIQFVESSKRIKSYCYNIEEVEYGRFKENLTSYFQKNCIKKFDIDQLVNVYELLIPMDEKKVNGMVFTPYHIKKFIIEQVIQKNSKEISSLTVCDPACGTGSFLITMAQYINEHTGLTFEYIYENILFGVDIYPHSISKAKLLLEILALQNGEPIKKEINYNLKVENSLDMDYRLVFPKVFTGTTDGFDIVIGNPPYVRAKNMDSEIRQSISRWSVCGIGNSDLYIPFFQLGIQILNPTGILGYISVNTYLSSLNGIMLREYLLGLRNKIEIINFKDAQMFKGVTSYTCINIIRKNETSTNLDYIKVDDISEYDDELVNHISFTDLDCRNGWSLGEATELRNIRKLTRFQNKLQNYGVKNGIATLKNDIYIFESIKEDKDYHYRREEGKNIPIEKSICKRIVKPNVIRTEIELQQKMEYIIFPYKINEQGKNVVMEENELKESFPCAYKFLLNNKEVLLKRDKGKALEKYPAWYAFGRTQGMNNYGKKLFVPYMTNIPVAVLSFERDILFYCGYALFSEDEKELIFLKKILESSLFWYYIQKVSKPYANGYMSLAKNYIKDFSIPAFKEEEINEIISTDDQEKINKLLEQKYDVYL